MCDNDNEEKTDFAIQKWFDAKQICKNQNFGFLNANN